MAFYNYRCEDCDIIFEVNKAMRESDRHEPCPNCDTAIEKQHLAKRTFSGFVNRDGSWTEGKFVPQLGPGHPDQMVTSKTQMEQVYRKNGICLDTGKFVSKEAQVEATVPRKKRSANWKRKLKDNPTVISAVRK